MATTEPNAPVTPATAAQVLSTVLSVEKAAPQLPGQTKADIVLGAINAGIALAPSILQLIQMFVSIFNQAGVFKKQPGSLKK